MSESQQYLASEVPTSTLNRRQALSFMGGAGLGAVALSTLGMESALAQAVSSVTPATGAAAAPKDIRATRIETKLQQLAPNVYAYIQNAAAGQSNYSVSNCGIIAGNKSLLAVDSTAAPIQAKNFIAAAMKATGKRFDRVVITHSHPDHTLGAQFFGDVDVIAHAQCRAALEMQLSQPKPTIWNALPGWANGTETFKRPLPNVTYTDQLSFYDYANGEVRLFWPGRGHTTGDTVVYLPTEKIVFLGDLGFFNVTPLNGNGFVADWIKICDRILAMDVTTLVPGHGPVGGKSELADMRDYLALIYREAKQRFDAGITAGRAAAEISLGKYQNWVDADRLLTNVVRLYSEFDGSITPGLINRDVLLKAQQEYDALRLSKP